MLLAIPLLPLLGFLINASFGRRISKAAAGAVACGAMLASFAIAVASVVRLASLEPDSRAIVSRAFTWISSGDFTADFTLRLDPLAAVMILVVTGIGTLIHVYSTAYMHEETAPEYARYFSYLNLFAAFMLLLVLGSNFLVMFVGWEGVGLCSYLLIGFWFEKRSASDAGKKAFIVNRIGDFGFVLGVLLAFVRFGTIDFQQIARAAAPMSPEAGFGTISIITLLLFVGATGKSAQIPLYVWLPDAMEGPTPVSALIHAATMVTAGVYMIGRNAVLFAHAPATLTVVAVIGTATALMAGTIALVQNDIKRVLAYSTVSQLGYMFLAMGVGAYAAGIFHLFTHAFFKALLFLGSGAVIHALGGEQDLRRMGGLKRDLPITYWTFLIGSIAIAGVPGFAGFFSKDEILFRTFASGHAALWTVGLLTALLTAIYMFRIVFLAFFGERPPEPVAPAHPEEEEPAAKGGHATGPTHLAHPTHLHDAPPAMALALIVLAIGSVLAGYASLGGRFERFLEPSFAPERVEEVADRGLELTLTAVSIAAALGGIAIAAYFFLKNRRAADRMAERFAGVRRLLQNKYYVDEIYNGAIVQPIRIVSENALWKAIDVRVIDGAVNGVGEAVTGASDILRRLQTGSVRAYAASLFLGVVLILGYYLWP
ncbi:MAG: NADH-quinone oxidoreductase subunit L [Acidobacteria bacterium]|nr:MAG: NADH-quinone oxidoreductase subunit L [Acidobacteriota bacterium]